MLVVILLHPGILIYQRFRDGFGLPPKSYYTYVAPGTGWLTILSSVCLLAFLAFEFRRIFAGRPWWNYLLAASDVAMLGIFYHGLRLGGQLQSGWFRGLWFFYGATLVLFIGYKYVSPFLRRSSAAATPAR